MTFASLRRDAALKLGTMLLRRGRWGPAASLLEHATRLAPDHWEAHNNLAVALLKLQRWEDAARVAERAASLDAGAADSHDFLAIALLQLERWEAAAAASRRAIAAAPGRYDSYDRLAMALWRLERWEELVETSEAAFKLDAGRYAAHHRAGIALQRLKRWDAAAAAFRRAIELASGDPAAAAEVPRLQTNLAAAVAQVDGTGESLMALLVQQAEQEHPGIAVRLNRAFQLLKAAQWDAALAELEALPAGIGGLQFLRVDPLVRLGRLDEAVAACHRAVAAGGPLPPLPGAPAAARIAQRQAAFWTPDNLGSDVFAVEQWLQRLGRVPDELAPGPRLLFVLDNDFGELTTVKYLLMGQALAGRAGLLLPERLYAHNADAIPGRTGRFGSVDDILEVVDRDRPEVVVLCSGYLFCPHLKFTPGDLSRLVDQLRGRGCRIVTADPFMGLLSRQDPRTLIRFEVSREYARELAAVKNVPWALEEMTKFRREAEERAWATFEQSERTLRDTWHLYPSFCEVTGTERTGLDARNVSFFNERLLRPAPVARAGDARPHWLFILATADCEVQAVVQGEGRFADVVAAKLVETLAAGRHPVLIAPQAFIDELLPRLPTAHGIDILAHCPFDRFMSLLLSAEHAFYWNVVSHSLMIRLFNQLPIVQFDLGHLVRSAPAIFERIVACYYQGWEPPLRDHRTTLTLETVEGWAADYRKQSAQLAGRYRRAGSPEQMLTDLMAQR